MPPIHFSTHFKSGLGYVLRIWNVTKFSLTATVTLNLRTVILSQSTVPHAHSALFTWTTVVPTALSSKHTKLLVIKLVGEERIHLRHGAAITTQNP